MGPNNAYILAYVALGGFVALTIILCIKSGYIPDSAAQWAENNIHHILFITTLLWPIALPAYILLLIWLLVVRMYKSHEQ